MPGSTISGYHHANVTLTTSGSPSYVNPVDVTGTITGLASGYALYGSGATDWTVTNAGTITGEAGIQFVSAGTITNAGSIGAQNAAIDLEDGGYVTNQATGTITNAGQQAIYATGAGATIANDGSIGAGTTADAVNLKAGGTLANQSHGVITGYTGLYLSVYGTVTNTGTIDAADQGLHLNAAAYVSNASGALITASSFAGIFGGGLDTLVNAGSIGASGGGNVLGAAFFDGAFVTNEAGGAITGTSYGVNIQGSPATVINAGSIGATGTSGAGVYVHEAGYLTNGTSGVISGSVNGLRFTGPGTAINAGSIGISGTRGNGVILNGGYLSNQSTGVISGVNTGVQIAGAGGTLVNAGSISVAGTTGYGVSLVGGGFITNQASGVVAGYLAGVHAAGSATVVNAGAVVATGTGANEGIDFLNGGAITNQSRGDISGRAGVYVYATQGTVSNTGTITGTAGLGANLIFGGVVDNQAGGTIAGEAGVFISRGGTASNAGTLVGTGAGQASVGFEAGYANLLTIVPGAVFQGQVQGGNTIGVGSVSTIDLASAASTGTLAGIGSQYVGFGQITVDVGASWQLTGSNSLAAGITLTNDGTLAVSNATVAGAGALLNDGNIVVDPSTVDLAAVGGIGTITIDALGTLELQGSVAAGQVIELGTTPGVLALGDPIEFSGTIGGLAPGDVFQLTGITDVTSATVGTSDVLQVIESGGATLELQLAPGFAGATFGHAVVGGDTDISVPCFAAGTRILTERGNVPVEQLRRGDRAISVLGGAMEIIWTGHREVDCARHPDPASVWPVRVAPGAFGPGLPARPLYLSPDHAVFVDPAGDGGVLIPVRYLLNETTIVQEPAVHVTYWHVECAQHDILLAEGLPAESYLETGNRGAFAEAGVVSLQPDFAIGARQRWQQFACRPLVESGPALEAARAHLAGQAAAMGFSPPLFQRVELDREGPTYAVLRAGIDRVHLVSACRVPEGERRRLGAAIAAITLDGAAVPLTDAALHGGFYPVEQSNGATYRWTNGEAVLRLPPADGLRLLAVGVAMLVGPPERVRAA